MLIYHEYFAIRQLFAENVTIQDLQTQTESQCATLSREEQYRSMFSGFFSFFFMFSGI